MGLFLTAVSRKRMRQFASVIYRWKGITRSKSRWIYFVHKGAISHWWACPTVIAVLLDSCKSCSYQTFNQHWIMKYVYSYLLNFVYQWLDLSSYLIFEAIASNSKLCACKIFYVIVTVRSNVQGMQILRADASIQRSSTLSHLENQVACSMALKSGKEFHFWLNSYVRYLVQEGKMFLCSIPCWRR